MTTKIDERALELASELRKLPMDSWIHVKAAADLLGVHPNTAWDAVLALAGAGYLEMTDPWTGKEKIRFRLHPSLR
jgi:Mn-dependent DtxR family transcriptional regulator